MQDGRSESSCIEYEQPVAMSMRVEKGGCCSEYKQPVVALRNHTDVQYTVRGGRRQSEVYWATSTLDNDVVVKKEKIC